MKQLRMNMFVRSVLFGKRMALEEEIHGFVEIHTYIEDKQGDVGEIG